MMPNAAQAACTLDITGNPDVLTCTGTTVGGNTLTNNNVNADDALVNVGNSPGTNLTVTSTVGVTLNGNTATNGSGGIAVNVTGGPTNTVLIQPTLTNTDAISITASANTRSKAITVNTSTYTTLDTQNGSSSVARDGIRVMVTGTTAVSSPVTITSASTIYARQDGVHVEEHDDGSSGKLTVTSTGAITAGYAPYTNTGTATDGADFADWNGISVEGYGSNVEINTSGAGTITMQSGNQAAIWSKTISGTTTINVGANITGTAQTSDGTYGAGVMVVSGGVGAMGGDVAVTLKDGAAINTAGNGIFVGQYVTSSQVVDNKIEITSSGAVTSVHGNGIQIAGFVGTTTGPGNNADGASVWHTSQITGAAADSNITITTKDGGTITADGTGGMGITLSTRGGADDNTAGKRADIKVTVGDAVHSAGNGVDLTTVNGNITVETKAADPSNLNALAGTTGGKITSTAGDAIHIVNGTGATTVNANADITATSGAGVFVSANNAAANNAINVTTHGAISAKGDGVHVEETTAGSTGAVTIKHYGSNASGTGGGINADDNGISVETRGGNISIETSESGTIDMAHGAQAAIWAKTFTGTATVDVGASIGTSGEDNGGSGVMVLTGSDAGLGGAVNVTLHKGSNIYANAGTTGASGILVGQNTQASGSGVLDPDAAINITSAGLIRSGGNGIMVGGFTGSPYESANVTGLAADSNITIKTIDGGKIDATSYSTFVGGYGINVATRGGGSTRANANITLGDSLTSESDGVHVVSTSGNVSLFTYAGDLNTNSSEGGDDASESGGSIISLNGYGAFLNAGGTITVTNNNHIEGATGGVMAENGTAVSITNNSLQSILASGTGAMGVEAANDTQVYFDNTGALTAALVGTGASIHDISGANFDVTEGDDTVDVDNYDGGVIAGALDGLSIDQIGVPSEGGGDSVYIDNAGYWQSGKQPGGLIIGLSGKGVGITNTEGDVYIDNSLTRNWGLSDLAAIDERVSTEGGLLEQVVTGLSEADVGLGGEFAEGTGIWGGTHGVYGADIDGHFGLDNSRGIIVGMQSGSYGIQLDGVGKGVTIDNAAINLAIAGQTSKYSLILGSKFGAGISDVSGDVDYYNTLGITYGHGDDGLKIVGVSEGGVNITNAAGIIESYLADAVAIDNVERHVQIDNKWSEGGDWYGGDIIGGGSAIAIGDSSDNFGSESAEINNGSSWYDWTSHSVQGGLIASRGGAEGTLPVIFLNTSDGESGGTVINNSGIIASLGVNPYPTFTGDNESDSFASNLDGIGIVGSLSQTPGDLNPIYWDAWHIAQATTNSEDGSIASIEEYRKAAEALAVQAPSESGSVVINNNSGWSAYSGIIFGRLDLRGVNEDGEGDDTIGNVLRNDGKWFTSGDNYLTSAGVDEVRNDGLVQTSFGSESGATTIHVDDFYNDGDSSPTVGVLSMLDDFTGSHTTIDGKFTGQASESGLSYLSIDAFLSGDGGGAAGDLLTITGKTYGTTGIIVHNTNPDPSTTSNALGILVVEAEGGVFAKDGYGGNCTTSSDAYCLAGDAFFIDQRTAGYQEVQGYGTIRDGLYSWFLQERPGDSGSESENFYLTSHFNSDSAGLVPTTSIIQTVSYEGLDSPGENNSGNEYPLNKPNQNNGGADPSGATTGQRGALWGRINGTWARRTTSVTDVVTYDTSSSQNVYSIMGGLEGRPQGGDTGLRLGIYGGYVSTSATLDGVAGETKASGGSVGGYVAFNDDRGWYADGEVKADFLGITYASPTTSLSTHGTNVATQFNTGFRMEQGRGFFEPIASFTYAVTSIADATDGVSTVTYGEGKSIRAGLGARTGIELGKPGGVQGQLDILGKVWDEFGGPNTVTINDGGPGLTASDNIAGISGEVVGRATIYNAERTTSGFVSVGGKFSSNASSISAKAGLRKNF
ncbi:MAG: hypothetical protein WDM94_07565 [Bauldia sp.]